MTHDELLQRIDHMAEVVFPAIKERTELITKTQKEKFDKTHTIVKINTGSYMMIRLPTRSSKLAPAYQGLYIVIRKTQGGCYVLQDETRALMPRDYPPSDPKLISVDETALADELVEVQAIINHRANIGRREYLVQWKGQGPEEDEWLMPDKFTNLKTIQDYWTRREKQELSTMDKIVPTTPKRGRPPKKVSNNEAANSAPKRRGRPPKQPK
ncbi:hypothetical protein PHYBLDRAFT_169815 [Phycomyces blakesleeanus NRRL 1555(-)]|uniref:Chromo domain-containing protein n=1 Tax=Phycomyces blakesleeanus (strain ATCC 8743b / DSM 1359 / FGSC 10004 / NBRC 33097 / NRRL 1555) TaxID=763407 RepID=A0A163A994_PHYB8|nr:hypothetical protein PHYBLDRAFT_169815 [Phycomyces blakesleeanus NRRL 1555(-)]OAD71901.1 hypothetical protein PHYBLDRAFT_169815 [Phycomyces blakesleeanus NRRL 1555(-)]|eukprot:XP_018289941.1 hypothetical protein PHYBLDRAFT_169815 [Phycomyces blakesleeanus NRRL 1555(-)]